MVKATLRLLRGSSKGLGLGAGAGVVLTVGLAPVGRSIRKTSVALLACIVLSAVASSSAFAGPPLWPEPPNPVFVHSTRVAMRISLRNEELTTKWWIEYVALKECNEGTPPGVAPEDGWRISNGGEVIGSANNELETVAVGSADPGEAGTAPVQLRYLSPNTCYLMRFAATNVDSKRDGKGEPEPSTSLFPFKTLPVGPAEVPKSGETEQEAQPMFEMQEITDHGVSMFAKVETNGADTEYSTEYAPASKHENWTSFTSGGSGTITKEEDYRHFTASTTGLAANTSYYVRIRMVHHESGKEVVAFQEVYTFGGGDVKETFTTGKESPDASVSVRNVTGDSAHVSAGLTPRGLETEWKLAWAPMPVSGTCPAATESSSWAQVPGGTGKVSAAQAESTRYSNQILVGASLGGLSVGSKYCVMVSASNAAGSATAADSFETEGPPSDRTMLIHELVGGSVEVFGDVNPKSVPTSEEELVTVSEPTGGSFTLTIGGHTSSSIAYNATAAEVEAALRGPAVGSPVQVQGVEGGPYTVFFGGNEEGSLQPLMTADASGLTPAPPASSVTVGELQPGGESTNTKSWLQYVTEKAFAEHEWEGAEESPPMEAGFGSVPTLMGTVLPGLKSGELYRFRVLAENALSKGSPAVGNEERLTVPVGPGGGASAGCPNEALRTGLSSALADCRTYELVSPAEKGAAQEPFHYSRGINSAVLVGEDGEHATLEAPEVDYGSGQSPYLFTREAGQGWRTIPGAPQPETGVSSVIPQAYSADLTKIALMEAYSPSQLGKSKNLEYKVGPVGGPYPQAVAVIPRQYEDSGWAAGNKDLSKLVFQTNDRELLGSETGTREGFDLYEYTTTGGLRQLNVKGAGSEAATIGTCGARMVHGEEGAPPSAVNPDSAADHLLSSSHSVSADGALVFFEAVPGRSCSEAKHLYMRVNGTETVDIGQYRFDAANEQGTRLLLKGASGDYVGYDTETRTLEPRSATEVEEDTEIGMFGISVRFEPTVTNAFAHPRFVYWTMSGQAYRFDGAEHVFECISCASPYAPEPKSPAFMGDAGVGLPMVNGGSPDFTAASANGQFAFFTTISELVPQDIDGEILPEEVLGPHPYGGLFINVGGHASPSTDVYEWRASGVNGCGLVQGCVSLITDGRSGYLNIFLGTADEGRDVFFYSRSVLSPFAHGAEGTTGEGNVYDARMGGGFLVPATPVVCESDECSVPPSAPIDFTPASFAFNGNGNVVEEPTKKTAGRRKAGGKGKHKKQEKRRKRRARRARKRTGGVR